MFRIVEMGLVKLVYIRREGQERDSLTFQEVMEADY
jgi:hypothetical protein